MDRSFVKIGAHSSRTKSKLINKSAHQTLLPKVDKSHNAYYGGSVGVASSFGTSSFLDFEKQDDTHAPLVNNQLQVGESLFELTDINTAHFFRYNFSTGNVSISALGGNGDQVVTVDDNGFLGTAAIGGGTPALPENQIAFGDNSDLLTSNSDLTFNGSVLTAPGLHVASTISVPAPTNAQAAQTCNAGCEYTANGNSFTYRVYSYKTFGSSRTYSDSYTSVNFNDDESSNSFDVTVSWTPAAGADGYRILVQNDAYNFDAGYDTTSTSFIDDACDSVCFDAAKSGTFPNSSGALFDGSIGVGGNIAIGQQLLQADSNDNFLIGRNNGSGTGYNFFVGVNTGNGATNVNGSNFLGLNAGINATNATESNFFGIQAGYHAANATESNFFGTGAGNFAASADHSNFLGSQAGYSASGASFSNFIGQSAGVFATNASHSNFIGAGGIGIRATNASYSNFFGWQTGTDASNASYSNLFGYHVGFNAINNGGSDNNIGSNNIIIGTNISLPDATADAINIGGILFGTGTYSDHTAAEPSFDPVAGGKIGIGVVTPSYTLQVGNSGVSGIVARFQNATGTCDINPTGIALSCSSDRTLKKNITAIDSASGDDGADAVSDATLQKILSLQPVTYNWNSEDDSAIAHAGFIAQDIRDVFPDLVSEDSTTHLLSLNYIGLIPYTIKALQEMDLKIAVLPVETDQTFTDRLTAFLKSIAENGVALIDGVQTKTIDTNTLCVADDTGAKTCITKEQLDALLEGNGHREHQHAHQKDDGATQGDGTSNGIDSHTGSDTTTTDTTSGAGDPTDPTTTDTPADTSSITDTAVVPVPESETPPAPDAAPAQ